MGRTKFFEEGQRQAKREAKLARKAERKAAALAAMQEVTMRIAVRVEDMPGAHQDAFAESGLGLQEFVDGLRDDDAAATACKALRRAEWQRKSPQAG